jgi:hypothetical protein
MIKLLIEDNEVDVLQTERIVGEYAIAPIGNISKRVGARSITFKLPKTAKNRAVFESAEVPTSLSVKPYRRLKARLYVDGVDMNMLFFTLERVTDFYEGRVYGSNADFFNAIKGKKIKDLDLRKYNHHWNLQNVIDSRFNTEGYIYPLINWNTETSFTINEKQEVKRYLVCFFYETLLNEICQQNGYSLNNKLLNLIEYNYADLLICSGSVKYNRDEDGSKYNGLFLRAAMQFFTGGSSPSYNEFLLTNIEQSETYWQQNQNYIGSQFYFPQIARFKYRISFTAYNVSSAGATNPIMKFFRGATFPPLEEEFTFSLDPLETKNLLYEGEFDTYNFSNLTNNAFAWRVLFFSGQRSVEITNILIEIFDCEAEIKNAILYDNVGTFSSVNNYVTVGSVLPELSQGEVFKQFAQIYNAVFSVDEKNKIVTTLPFKSILSNINNPVDWSGKLDFKKTNTTTFTLEYGQKNSLKYADDETVVKPEGTDFIMNIDDENLPPEFAFIELNFAASEMVNWFTNPNNTEPTRMPVIKVIDGVPKKTVKPRIVYLKKVDGFFHTYQSGTTQVGVVTQVPLCYFIDEEKTYSLGFEENLFNTFYLLLQSILDRTKVIECLIRLNTSDIATFDFLRPVYIKELDGYFYVSKIKFEYTSNASSVCELVKLL